MYDQSFTTICASLNRSWTETKQAKVALLSGFHPLFFFKKKEEEEGPTQATSEYAF